jgi:hypothetical protein
MSKTQLKSLEAVMNCKFYGKAGGAVMAGHWSTGAGLNLRVKVLPPFCECCYIDEYLSWYAKGTVKQALLNIKKKYPRAVVAIVCIDVRKANKALKALEVATNE